jgi:hypothetical protein
MRVIVPKTYKETNPNGLNIQSRWEAIWPENPEPNASILFADRYGAIILKDGNNRAFHTEWKEIRFPWRAGK